MWWKRKDCNLSRWSVFKSITLFDCHVSKWHDFPWFSILENDKPFANNIFDNGARNRGPFQSVMNDKLNLVIVTLNNSQAENKSESTHFWSSVSKPHEAHCLIPILCTLWLLPEINGNLHNASYQQSETFLSERDNNMIENTLHFKRIFLC